MNREKAVAANAALYVRAPRSFQHLEDLLALPDVDAVLISTPEHSHSPILKMVVEAGKDAYVEKPMGNVLEEAKAARAAVRECGQHRPGRHPAPQRALPAGGARARPDRRARGGEQGRGGVELPRAALARARRGRPDPRAGHGLAPVAHDQALPPVRPSALLRVPSLPRVLERHPRPVDEPRNRPGALVHGRQLSALGGGPRRRLRLARRP